jgi:hypothetical protein
MWIKKEEKKEESLLKELCRDDAKLDVVPKLRDGVRPGKRYLQRD